MMQEGHFNMMAVTPEERDLRALAEILHYHSGIVISPEKGSMVQSRLAKRLRAKGLNDYGSYVELIQSDAGRDELREMISALTTNVTHFFRENHHFEILRQQALPKLVEYARAGGRMRIWSAGSSDGQEAYSIAMVLHDLEPNAESLDIRILATDIDPRMISRGKAGLYDSHAIGSIPVKLRERYFIETNGGCQIDDCLRRLVTFKELNLHHDWPFHGPFDIIFCRNVVIYFAPDAQARLWRRFEEILKPEGWLFAGHSERVPLGLGSDLRPAGITAYRRAQSKNSSGAPSCH
jgi:chemotaxis protein methyltransferase CheR